MVPCSRSPGGEGALVMTTPTARDGGGRPAAGGSGDPMILYRHAPNKAALLDGVAETVLAQLHVDSADVIVRLCIRIIS